MWQCQTVYICEGRLCHSLLPHPPPMQPHHREPSDLSLWRIDWIDCHQPSPYLTCSSGIISRRFCSIILPGTEVDWPVCSSLGLPNFPSQKYMDVLFSVFQFLGTSIWNYHNFSNTMASGLATSSPSSLRAHGCISSYPMGLEPDLLRRMVLHFPNPCFHQLVQCGWSTCQWREQAGHQTVAAEPLYCASSVSLGFYSSLPLAHYYNFCCYYYYCCCLKN